MTEIQYANKKKYLKELISKQLKTIPVNRRLLQKDMMRITKYINSSVFGEKCCVWEGYITNSENVKKGTYINFFFRNKKVALHRLLYENYVGELGDDHYLKFSCDNEQLRGSCCNVLHMIKYKYNFNTEDEETKKPETVKSNDDTEHDLLTVRFD